MTSILEGELAQTISDALIDAGIPYDVTVTRTVRGDYDPAVGGYPETTTHYPCKGFVESYSDLLRATGVVGPGDVKIVVLGPTLDIVPSPTDTITARGRTFSIISVTADPAGATIEVQGRG